MAPTCHGCEWTVPKLISEFHEVENVISFLISHNLIRNSITCPLCQSKVPLNREKLLFICDEGSTEGKEGTVLKNSRCNFMTVVWQGSLFEHSYMKVKAFILLTYYFVSSLRRTCIIAKQLNISPRTLVNWLSFCREVLVYYCVEESQVLGGQGTVVELYQAKIGKKYTKGTAIEGKWVIGGVQRDDKKLFFAPVNDLREKTVMKTIKKYIVPGTTVITDSLSSFKTLANHGYVQRILDDTDTYVCPDTGKYKACIKKFWKEVQGPCRGPRKTQYFESYLAELLFRKMYMKQSERFHYFLLLAGQLYSPKLIPRNQDKHEEQMKLLQTKDIVMTDRSMGSNEHHWPVLPPVFHFREEDNPVKTYSEIKVAEDIKQEDLEVQEEESMGDNFEIKEEMLDIEIKDEKIEDVMKEEFKEEVEEEEPVRVTAWSSEETEVPCYHELMEETGASQKNERRALEEALNSAEMKRATVAVTTCHEPYQNIAENIGINQNGSSDNVQKNEQLALVSSERSRLLFRDTRSYTCEQQVQQKKCLYTAVNHFGLSCSVEGDHLSFAPPGPATQIFSKDAEIFTTEQEEELVKCLEKAHDWFDGIMYQDARILAYKFAVKYNIKCYPSWDICGFADAEWFRKFLRRHPSFSLKNPRNHYILSTGDMNHILNTVPKLINVTITSKDNLHKCSVCHSCKYDSHKLSRSLEFECGHRYASQSKVYQIKSTKKSVGFARHNWLYSDACQNKKQKDNLLNIPVSLENGECDDSLSGVNVVKIVSTKNEGYIPKNVSKIIDAKSDVCHVKHEWLFNKTPEKEKEDNILFSKPVSPDKDSGDFNESESDVCAGETVFVDVEEDLFTHTKNVYY